MQFGFDRQFCHSDARFRFGTSFSVMRGGGTGLALLTVVCVSEIMNICRDAPQAAGPILLVEDPGSVTSKSASLTDISQLLLWNQL